MKVLLAANPGDQQAISAVLQRGGCHVMIAEDMRTAEEQLALDSFSAVLVELNLYHGAADPGRRFEEYNHCGLLVVGLCQKKSIPCVAINNVDEPDVWYARLARMLGTEVITRIDPMFGNEGSRESDSTFHQRLADALQCAIARPAPRPTPV